MAVTRKYSLSAVRLNTGAPVLISGILSQGLGLGATVDQEPTSGEVYPRWTSVTGLSPDGRFATYHLATALASIGLTGLNIGSLATGLEFWLQQHALGSTRAGVLSHRKTLIKAGIVFPLSVECNHGPNQHGRVSYQVTPVWDGANDIVQISDGETLPTAEADDERFGLGPIAIGGKTIDHVDSLTVDFGINAVVEGKDGDICPSYVSIETLLPSIRLRGIDPEWFAAAKIPLAGLACTHANTILYLRKRALGDGFVANGVAQHIKFTACGLAVIDDAQQATGSGAAETSLILPLRYDGANAPLTINTASAIT